MRFFIYGLLVIIILLVFVFAMLAEMSLISGDALLAAVYGAALSVIFVTSGFVTFSLALKYPQKKFNKIVGISILGRLVLMTLCIVSILIFLNIDKTAFLIGMLISYFIAQILEVVSFNKTRIGKA